MANDPTSAKLTNLYTHLQTLIKKWVYDKPEVDNKLSNKLDKAQTSYKGKNVIVDSSSGNIAFEDKNNHTHSQYLTEHQSLASYYNKSETNNYDVDFILGTQTTSTSAWTGATSVISSLRAGTTIFYKLPYASTSTSVTLNLTLKGGGTTGAKNVFYKNTTRVTTHFGVGQVVGLTYDGTAWYVISPSDNNSNNDNNYGGIQFKAGEALTTQTICCAKVDGMYYKVANGVVLDIRYPLIMTSSAVTSGTTTNAMYRTWYGVNIANTKSMTLTNGSQLFLEGTAYSDGKFTISSNVVTHTLTNGRYYIKVGTALSTTQIRFISDMTIYYYNGTTLKPAIKKEQIVDYDAIFSLDTLDCINENFTILSLPQIIITYNDSFFNGGYSVLLAQYFNGAYVDWGDGTPIETYEKNDKLEHVYSDNVQEHTIIIYGEIADGRLISSSFANLSGITNINLPSTIIHIDTYCFDMCLGMTSINIPSTVQEMDSYCFFECTGLNTIILNWTESPIPYSTSMIGSPTTISPTFSIPYGTTSLYESEGYPTEQLVERSE